MSDSRPAPVALQEASGAAGVQKTRATSEPVLSAATGNMSSTSDSSQAVPNTSDPATTVSQALGTLQIGNTCGVPTGSVAPGLAQDDSELDKLRKMKDVVTTAQDKYQPRFDGSVDMEMSNFEEMHGAPRAFDVPLPDRIPSIYQTGNPPKDGVKYAVYSLVQLDPNGAADLVSSIMHEVEPGTWSSTIALAPKYDFAGKTLRDIYGYHLNLLDARQDAVAPGKFIVAAHKDWQANGVLVVEFASDGKNLLGIIRVKIDQAAASVMVLENDLDTFKELKAEELINRWPEEIAGYSTSKYKLRGADWAISGVFRILEAKEKKPASVATLFLTQSAGR